MSYSTAEEIVSPPVRIGEIGYRKLTESQGARSAFYQVLHRGTSDEIHLEQGLGHARLSPVRYRKKIVETIAKREHVGRLLRNCQSITESIRRSDDRTELAMLGARLCDTLDQMWQHRLAREDDWIEVLNVLQIVLRGESFENMSESKKNALAEVFTKGLLTRTISRLEAQRAAQLLTDAGFDLWRGLRVETQD